MNDQLSETCIGVDFCNGRYVAPNAKKVCRLLIGISHCIRTRPWLSALELSALLGAETWIGLLNRPSLARFFRIYEITMTLSSERAHVDEAICLELVLFLCIVPTLRERPPPSLARDVGGDGRFH